MSGLFDRLGSAFIAPPREGERAASRLGPDAPQPARREPPPREPPRRARLGEQAPPLSLTVLCRADDAVAAGGAAGLALAARHRSSHALVAVWGAADGAVLRAPAGRSARRLAATLEARGHDAAASGRLTVVRLAADLHEAAPEAVRAMAAAGDVPAVVVLGGARDEAADVLLRELDGVLVALPEGADEAVADLALAGIAPLAARARAIVLPPCPVSTRALAASGVALLPPLRGVIDANVAGRRR